MAGKLWTGIEETPGDEIELNGFDWMLHRNHHAKMARMVDKYYRIPTDLWEVNRKHWN